MRVISKETRHKMSLARIGKPSSWLGCKHSEESKDKIRQAHLGKPKSEEARAKMSLAKIGKPLSEETRHKISLTQIGRPSPMLGKSHTEETKDKMRQVYLDKPNLSRLGCKHSEETRAKMSLARCNRLVQPRLGCKHSEEARAKMSLAHQGEIRTEETKEKIRQARLKQVIPFKDTSIELALQKSLIKAGITFRTHEPILGQPDIFVEPNMCIFADGDYWHSRPGARERDERVNSRLIERGYVILRFSEHEIRKGIDSCMTVIFSQLGFYFEQV